MVMAPSQAWLSPSPGAVRGFVALRGMKSKRALPSWLVWPLAMLCLIWPALWNGYPIVFADTGTYLSQAMHGYLGWDRPIFYSLFILPLHLGLTTWTVVLVQAWLTVFVLDLCRRAFNLAAPFLLPLILFLAVATWLPWTVSELMPDLFTPLLVLLLCLLIVPAARLSRWRRVVVTALTALMIATQQSSVPLALGLLAIVIPARWIARPAACQGGATVVLFAPLLAPGLAITALVLMNAIGFGRFSLSPYGNVFVLARVIYDGPGMAVLRRDCPERGWRLCPWLDRFPATADDFLWDKSSPIILAGGHKAISSDADAIVAEAVRTQPGQLIAATWNNAVEQLTRFASGDGLERWNEQVAPWIDQDFPAWERAGFHAARQQSGALAVPPPLAMLHRVTALAGIAAAVLLLPIARRRRHVSAWFMAIALLTLPLSAAITGGLSTPHDRYQSRIIWLPAATVFLTIPALLRRRQWPQLPGQSVCADRDHEPQPGRGSASPP